jgi:hypothetical protein
MTGGLSVEPGSSRRPGLAGHHADSAIGGAFLDPEADRSALRVRVPYFGNCLRPVPLAHPLGRDVEYAVRCRSCPGCLRARTFLWRLRTEAEALSAHHNVLFTGTFREQYLDRRPCSEEVTKFLKRLRERGPYGALRYLVCFERHRSGAWHVHACLHSVGEGFPHLGLHASSAWQAGFSNAKAVNLAGVGYVSKYVAKDLADHGESSRRPRIRASRAPSYGWQVLDRSEDVLEALRARRVDVSEVHRINLLSLLKYSGREKDSVWKEIANSMQKSGRLLLGSEQSALREVDRETGEILPTRK